MDTKKKLVKFPQDKPEIRAIREIRGKKTNH